MLGFFYSCTLYLLSKLGVSPCSTTVCDKTDTKKILTASPLQNWRSPGCPRTTWMKTIQQDLKSNNLSLNEAIDMAQIRPLWRLMSMFGAAQYALLVELAIKEQEDPVLAVTHAVLQSHNPFTMTTLHGSHICYHLYQYFSTTPGMIQSNSISNHTCCHGQKQTTWL